MIIRESPDPRLRHIAVLALDGAYQSSVSTWVDAVSLAGRGVDAMFEAAHPMRTHLRLLSVNGRAAVSAARRPIEVDGGIATPETYRICHLPAFEVADESALLERLARVDDVCDWLQRQREGRALISASGAAVFVLARAGLLNDGAASVPKPLTALFRRLHPRVRVDARASVVEHRGVLSAATLAAEWQLVTRLIEGALSPHLASWLATTTGLRRDPGDHPYLSDDPVVAGAQFWLGERFAENFKISDLARDLSVSHPTLIRRFSRALGETPRDYAQRLRVEAAKRMLVTTQHPVSVIGAMVGYADARAFRTLFREHTAMTPQAYRDRGGNGS